MRKPLAGIWALMFAALACNAINQAWTTSSPSQSAVATVVAQTMQAVERAAGTPSAALATPALTSPSPSATPMAVVKAVSYCRTGPGENYKSLTDLKADQEAALLGKDETGDYWLIVSPAGECWVAAQDVAITGSTQNVPEVTAPPSTSQGVPAAPGSLYYNYSCASLTQAAVTLTWQDAADNETGYRVYRNGTLLAELPANSTTYTDDTSRGPGRIFSYSVEAFNSSGTSPQRTTGGFRLSNCANP